MKIDMKIVGKRIKTMRDKRRLTLEQLARLIDRDKQTIWRWEKAERNISLKTLNLLADKLQCHPFYLLGYDESMVYEPALRDEGLATSRERGAGGKKATIGRGRGRPKHTDASEKSEEPMPEAFLRELAEKMAEIDPQLVSYLCGTKPTHEEAGFIAAALRLAFKNNRGNREA